MAVKLTSCKLWANLTAGWTDITDDAIGALAASWGMSGTSPTDRLAETGTMQFSLDNSAGYYTPGGASVRAGWKKGVQVKAVMIYDGDSYIRFFGVVDAIEFEVRSSTMIFAHVTVVDWMNYAATQPMIVPALMLDATADQALNSIVAEMPIKPKEKAFELGANTFTSVFDITRVGGRAYSEFAKINNSELGYLYLTKPAGSGESLVFENMQHRNGLLPLTLLPKAASSFLLMETGDKLLLETGDKIYLNELEASALVFDTEVINLGITHGDNLANRISMTAYPRTSDASTVVLYMLGGTTQIGAGETKEFRANYNSSGVLNTGGFDMIVPVATTDYTLNTASDGTGTNLTASAIVTVSFGANSANCIVTNNTTNNGYITFFQLRGKGLYTLNIYEYAAEDFTSINLYGVLERSFDQKYLNSTEWSAPAANTQLYIDRYPRVVLRSIRYCANRTSSTMMAFLNYDVGSLIKVADTAMGTTGGYIIQGISFEVVDLGIIWVSYALAEHYSLLAGNMSRLSMSFTAGSKDAINYGYLPQVSQTGPRSFAAWVYYTGTADAANHMILSAPFSDGGGLLMYLKGLTPWFYSSMFATSPGLWYAADDVVASEWHHIVVTYDAWDVNANPVFYVDGSSSAVTEDGTPAGALLGQVGSEVVLGNWHSATQDYGNPFIGVVKDSRIYNRIITSAEVTTLYNGGTPDASLVTSGLVFQGPVVMSKDAATYNNATLTGDMQVLDNIYRAVGIPSDAPVALIWT